MKACRRKPVRHIPDVRPARLTYHIPGNTFPYPFNCCFVLVRAVPFLMLVLQVPNILHNTNDHPEEKKSESQTP